MPRGKKKDLDYNEQIELIDEKIKKYTQRISDLKQQRQEYAFEQQRREMTELQSYMKKHDLDPVTVLAALESAAAASGSSTAVKV